MRNLVIFASGAGSNTQKIIDHFKNSTLATVSLIISNKPEAGVLQIACHEKIPSMIINRHSFYQSRKIVDELLRLPAGLIVLAGFLWKVPEYLIEAFPCRIINIHPALLPKHGGKGMYGMYVHKAVIASGEKESGITIHYVNEKYDEGEMILQKACPVAANDTPESLAQKVH
ncbi:MAG: phosphoribosylglycinamide formyltransferase, partial [Chitinophagaceae bacterium]